MHNNYNTFMYNHKCKLDVENIPLMEKMEPKKQTYAHPEIRVAQISITTSMYDSRIYCVQRCWSDVSQSPNLFGSCQTATDTY